MKSKLIEIIALVLQLPEKDVDENITAKTAENWDSINHMNLIVAIEEEFDIMIEDEMVTDLKSFEALHTYLNEKVKV